MKSGFNQPFAEVRSLTSQKIVRDNMCGETCVT